MRRLTAPPLKIQQHLHNLVFTFAVVDRFVLVRSVIMKVKLGQQEAENLKNSDELDVKIKLQRIITPPEEEYCFQSV